MTQGCKPKRRRSSVHTATYSKPHRSQGGSQSVSQGGCEAAARSWQPHSCSKNRPALTKRATGEKMPVLLLTLVSPPPSPDIKQPPAPHRACSHCAQPFGLPSPQALSALNERAKTYEETNVCISHGSTCCTSPKGLEYCVGTLICKDGECSGFEQDRQSKQQEDMQEKQVAPELPRLTKTETQSQAANPPKEKEAPQGSS